MSIEPLRFSGSAVPHLMFGESVIAIGVYSDGVYHHSKFCNTPSHNERTHTEVLLERGSEGHKTADIKRYSNVASPAY